MRTSNPALSEKAFQSVIQRPGEGAMTLEGTINRSGILFLLLTLSAAFSWNLFYTGQMEFLFPMLLGGAIVGFILAMVTIFKKEWSPVTAPLYALAEGMVLGAFSSIFETKYPGIVIQAVGLTPATFATLLLTYKSGLIRATENFKLGVIAATGGIALVYLVDIVLGFFHRSVPFLNDAGPIGIGISVFIVIIAALNLVLDFDFIEQGVQRGAPKYMEWYGAFGLMVTLVWLYLEILRLLAKSRERR
jgi:uncharacterized YccA/Bax inhibitor family protein